MKNQFEMSSLGEMNYFLGLEVYQSEDGIFLNQEKCAHEVLKKFRMESCKSIPTPLVLNLKLSKEDGAGKLISFIGNLFYLTSSRPDLMFATSLLSRFMQNPSEIHFVLAKRPSKNGSLTGYVDSDWAGNLDEMKSITRYSFSLGSSMFCWNSKNKSAISIAENLVRHGKTKHIQEKFHVIREATKNHDIKLIHCFSNIQVSDILTKALPRAKFEKLRG
ncbi:Copia protein, partial [Mucuna pruriens]